MKQWHLVTPGWRRWEHFLPRTWIDWEESMKVLLRDFVLLNVGQKLWYWILVCCDFCNFGYLYGALYVIQIGKLHKLPIRKFWTWKVCTRVRAKKKVSNVKRITLPIEMIFFKDFSVPYLVPYFPYFPYFPYLTMYVVAGWQVMTNCS